MPGSIAASLRRCSSRWRPTITTTTASRSGARTPSRPPSGTGSLARSRCPACLNGRSSRCRCRLHRLLSWRSSGARTRRSDPAPRIVPGKHKHASCYCSTHRNESKLSMPPFFRFFFFFFFKNTALLFFLFSFFFFFFSFFFPRSLATMVRADNNCDFLRPTSLKPNTTQYLNCARIIPDTLGKLVFFFHRLALRCGYVVRR
jgi:hypothetical protein